METRTSRPRLVLALCAGLILLVLIPYSQVSSHSFLNLDDNRYLTENPNLEEGLGWEGLLWAITTTWASNWHPVTWMGHLVLVSLFDLEPGPHHMANVLLHAAAVVLLFLFFLRATSSPAPSALVAALFALHPLHVEVVAWAAELKELLSFLFLLLCLHSYLGWTRRPTRRAYAAVAGFFALALLAKPMAVTLPLLLLCLDVWPLERVRLPGLNGGTGWRSASPCSPWKCLLEKVPLLFLSLASGLMTLMAQRSGGAISTLETLPLSERAANALVSVAAYLHKTVWPAGLAPFYPYRQVIPWWQVLISGLLLVLVTTIAWRLRRSCPWLLSGWSWFLIALLPVLGLIQVGAQSMADRYTYLPHVGLFMALVWCTLSLPPLRSGISYPAVIGVIIVLTVLAFLTGRQVGYWKDDLTLFSHTLRVTKDNYLAHTNLGKALAESGRTKDAVAHFRRAATLHGGYGDIWINLGSACLETGRIEESITALKRAVALEPGRREGVLLLARALVTSGRPGEAVPLLEDLSEKYPGDVAVLYRLGETLLLSGEARRAAGIFEDLLQRFPGHPEAGINLGTALLQAGDTEGAVRAYREALRSSPRHPSLLRNLAIALLREGKREEACRIIREAREVAPEDPSILEIWRFCFE